MIIIYLDDPSARPLFEAFIRGRPILLLPGSTTHPEMTPESRTIVRQMENVQHAIKLLLERGSIDWLLHIDMDELLFEPQGKRWDELHADASCVRLTNYEAVPLDHDTTNPFFDCQPFRLNNSEQTFMAYGNGKSAVRLRPGVYPFGPHHFGGFEGEAVRVARVDAVVLHYPTPCFESWRAKFLQYGEFSDFWYGDPKVPNHVTFMLRSRDKVRAAKKSGDWSSARRFFDGYVLNEQHIAAETARGMICHLDPLAGDSTP